MGTTTAILQITDNIYESIELNQIAALMTVDESAAFDTMSHDILTEKIKLYNFHEDTIKWFRSFPVIQIQLCCYWSEKVIHKIHVNRGTTGVGARPHVILALHQRNARNSQEIRREERKKHKDAKDNIHGQTLKLFRPNCRNCGAFTNYADDSTFVNYKQNLRRKSNQTDKSIDRHKDIFEQ